MSVLIGDKPRAQPSNLPREGGTTEVTIPARASSGTARLQIRYSLDKNIPYVFADSPDPGKPRETWLKAAGVTFDWQDVGRSLTLRRQGQEPIAVLFIDLDVQEIDPSGKPVGLSRGRVCQVTLT